MSGADSGERKDAGEPEDAPAVPTPRRGSSAPGRSGAARDPLRGDLDYTARPRRSGAQPPLAEQLVVALRRGR
jgi:hypothetical protein